MSEKDKAPNVSDSRRAFLMGRRRPTSPWETFCRKLEHAIEGTLYDFGEREGVGSARLSPSCPADVYQARRLCAALEVTFALDGVAGIDDRPESPVLWVEANRELAQFRRLDEGSPLWFVQPGCMLGELDDAGLHQFHDLAPYLTVAGWLADRSLCDWAPGETWRSGVEHACVLLGDGTRATLGPFGPNNRKPLEGLVLQRMVTSLFELSNLPSTESCRQAPWWPARYHLDALKPTDGHTLNLAHLLLGAGGDLGWVDWVVLDERCAESITARPQAGYQVEDEALRFAAGEVDAQVKLVFDPDNVFSSRAQPL